jgi:SecD/SecF fusion protein
MEQTNNKLRWIVLAILVLVAAWKVAPTIRLAMIDNATLESLEPAEQVELRANSIKQGLDLQGGMHMVLEVDLVELIRNLARHSEDSRFKARMDRVNEGLSALTDFWSLFASEFKDVQLSEWFGERRQTNDEIILKLKEQSVDAIDNSLVILRNRVDGSGLQEPSITKQGQRRIVVELAGVNDPGAARNMIGKTALLEFKLVEKVEKTNKVLEDINSHLAGLNETTISDETPVEGDVAAEAIADEAIADEANAADTEATKTDSEETFDPFAADPLESATAAGDPTNNPLFNLLTVYPGRGGVLVAEDNRTELMELLSSEDVMELMPHNVEFVLGKLEAIGDDSFSELFLIDSEAMLTGKSLETAGVNIDQGGNSASAGSAIVELTMNRQGARRFARITGDNINRRLAIVLDNRVFMAPNIRSKIPNGRAIIEGLDSITEAKELANLLKHGALPSTVKPVEERTVGPSLGKESVEKGAFSFVLGFFLVIVFMMIYYKKAGVFSVVALLLNMLFVLAILAGFGATLTLPGIAGIILTIGMAVDANVLIFERIREELRIGRTVRASVDAGYAHAFSTIVDANVTTLIAGIVLYQFGSGPIRGFALTLMIGITASMYTAIVVTRLLFDAMTNYDRANRLSI